MNTKINWKLIYPHVMAVLVFYLFACVYSSPALSGEVLQQSDIQNYYAIIHGSTLYAQSHDGVMPLWNNDIFSGMPNFLLLNLSANAFDLIRLEPYLMLFTTFNISIFFLLCISFYFLTQVLKIHPIISVMSSLAYAYTNYNVTLLVAGHNSKLYCLGYLPAFIAALWLLYHKRYLWGTALVAIFTYLFLYWSHWQIIYYGFIVAGIMTVAFFIQWIKVKAYKHLMLICLLICLDAVLVIGAFSVNLFGTYQFTKLSTRGGGTVLNTTNNVVTKNTGLSLDYAMSWSYGKMETFTFLVPDLYGGGSAASPTMANTLINSGFSDDQSNQIASQLPSYWGNMPFTSGPFYAGSIILFLSIFALVFIPDKQQKRWMLACVILAILMAWGSNFLEFNKLLFYYLPGYNKFRAPNTSLVILDFLFPLLAAMGLQSFLFTHTYTQKQVREKLKISAFIMIACFVIVLMFYIGASFTTDRESTALSNYAQVFDALKQDRKALLGNSIFRSIVFILLAFLTLFFVAKGKLKKLYAMYALLLLSAIDLIAITRQYYNYSLYQTAQDVSTANFPSNPIYNDINKDTTFFRVLDESRGGDPFSDAIPSYYVHSIGGYFSAKISIYEDVLNSYLRNQSFNMNSDTMATITGPYAILNMLNTKYMVVASAQNNQAVIQKNLYALGNAWFVPAVVGCMNNIDMLRRIGNTDLKDSALVNVNNMTQIPYTPIEQDEYIHLESNDHDRIVYQSNSNHIHLAVFSEIYYPDGWKATIDGVPVQIIQTNYILRGIYVPAGKHDIVFTFKPHFLFLRYPVFICSIIIWLILLMAIVQSIRTAIKKEK